MVVPQFIRFYSGYTVDSALGEYAKTFFSMVNAMNRIRANEIIEGITMSSAPYMDESNKSSLMSKLKKDSSGISGIIQEVRIIRSIKDGRD